MFPKFPFMELKNKRGNLLLKKLNCFNYSKFEKFLSKGIIYQHGNLVQLIYFPRLRNQSPEKVSNLTKAVQAATDNPSLSDYTKGSPSFPTHSPQRAIFFPTENHAT